MFVIILAPPLFPLPLDWIAKRILKQFLPIGVPCCGLVFKSKISCFSSAFNEAYFLLSLLLVFQKHQWF
jgi:hypothetical protein